MSLIRSMRLCGSSFRSALVSTRLSSTATPFVLSNVLRRQPSVVMSGYNASRSFSATVRALGKGEIDIGLSKKLEEELKYEKEAEASSGEPEFLQAFKQSGLWMIEDNLGHEEVTLSRTFGNEEIRLTFSVADVQSEDSENFENPESENEQADEEGLEEPMQTYPIRAAVTISKGANAGALGIDLLCQEGHFVVENVAFYKDAKLATSTTAEADWSRRGLYMGPQFDTLDLNLQEEIEKFLQERGINESMALFIPEYAEHKEQTEYVKWLGNVKSFVDQ